MSGKMDADVLIVGYGPVGAALACLLGRYGVRTCVIDKATEIFMSPRAIALDNEALRILQMVGLSEQAFDRVPIPYVKMHSPYVGQFAHINTSGTIDGHPKLVTFYQPDLERALREEAASHATVDVRLGIELLSLKQVEGVEATVRDNNGQESMIRTRFVVGADGASSRVRQLIGQDFKGRSYAEDWLIVDAKNVPASIDHVEFICDPKRPTPHMVAPGGRTRWEFMLQPGEKREEMESDEALKTLLAPWGNPDDMEIERRAIYRFHALCCKSFSKGKVFLVGDAAHVTPPFVGQGLVAGLRDVANLGWKLAWVAQGWAAPRILDSYDQERRPHAKAMIQLARFMGSMVMPQNALAAIGLHGVMRSARANPALRPFLEDLGVKPKNRFSKGLFTKGRGRLRRGACLPQFWLRDQEHQLRLSDDILADSLTLVGFGRDPAEHLTDAERDLFLSSGGHITQICLPGEALHRGSAAWEDISGALLPDAAPYGWCAVIRPDRVVVNDGPVTDAARLLESTRELMA